MGLTAAEEKRRNPDWALGEAELRCWISQWKTINPAQSSKDGIIFRGPFIGKKRENTVYLLLDMVYGH